MAEVSSIRFRRTPSQKNLTGPIPENNRLLFEMTSKYGNSVFFQLYYSDMQPSDVRSMCCRLQSGSARTA